jgi:hypothetical protein
MRTLIAPARKGSDRRVKERTSQKCELVRYATNLYVL